MDLEEYKDAWSSGFEECKRLFKVMEPAQPVSRQIRDLRKARGLTQEGLAQLTGMKAQQIQRLENNGYNHRWSIASLNRIAKALNLQIEVQFVAPNTNKGD